MTKSRMALCERLYLIQFLEEQSYMSTILLYFFIIIVESLEWRMTRCTIFPLNNQIRCYCCTLAFDLLE